MSKVFEAKNKGNDDFWNLSALIGKEEKAPSMQEYKKSVQIPLSSIDPPSVRRDAQYSASPLGSVFVPLKESTKYTVPDHPFIISVKDIKTGESSSFADSFSVYLEKYKDVEGRECAYVSVYANAYVYSAFPAEALSYFFWWRSCQRRGEYIKCDVSYLSLRMAELINGNEYSDAESALAEMWRLYSVYADVNSELYVSGAESLLAEIICDYSLIHALPIPSFVSDEMIILASQNARFREIFFDSAHPECFLRLLLRHASDHAISTTRYADQMAGIDCEKYVCGALAYAIRKAKRENIDHPLAMSFKEKTTLQRAAFGSNVFLLPKNRLVLRIEFCSANRSYTLRNTVTGIVKHCENCLRAHVGISARLKIYSLEPFFRDAVDEFFAMALPKRQKVRMPKSKAQEVVPEYERFYDLPKNKEFSVERAKMIEERSWELTERLVVETEDAFTDMLSEAVKVEEKKESCESTPPCESFGEELDGILALCPQYSAFLLALKEGNRTVWEEESKNLGKPASVIADEINAASFDVLGDVLIEDDGGGLSIIEDYLYIFDEK